MGEKLGFKPIFIAVQILGLTNYVLGENGFKDQAQCGQSPRNSLSNYGQLSGIDVPWNAPLNRRTALEPHKTFAGILVSPSVVFVSAAFFTEEKPYRLRIYPEDIYIVSLDTHLFGDPSQSGADNSTIIPITQVRIHPNYNPAYWAETENRFALVHLSEPVLIGENLHPVCLPDCQNENEITQLYSASKDEEEEEIVLTGWNRYDTIVDKSLRLKIQGEDKCRDLWENETDGETEDNPYHDRWCAVVGQQNIHTNCIHKDVGALREINGSQVFAGIVNELYSTDGVCLPNSKMFFEKLTVKTFKWIEDNVRCGPDNFTCSDGECIPLSKRCDRQKDCFDESDEDETFCRALNYCANDEFPCGIYDGCIPFSQENDGIPQCPNGEDENADNSLSIFVWILIGSGILVVIIGAVTTLFTRKRIKDLKEEIRNLTPQEEKEFQKGKTIKEVDFKKGSNRYTLSDLVAYIPWPKEKEIPERMIHIEYELKRGHFGIVSKGQLLDFEGKRFRCDVAVKKPIPSIGITEFKALLYEIKILANIGSHENVVGFFGANTTNIRKREVLLLLEYCPNGNVRDYILENKIFFKSLGTDRDYVMTFDNPAYINHLGQGNRPFGVIDLIRWSQQAAAGMAYLASKSVIHRDVAARNLLLSSTLQIKIGDFGISRVLEGSDIYTAIDSMVPWKWLAIEALQNLTFSEKTDVWAYGITMWELLSLGGIPFEGRNWDPSFLQDLLFGLRLEKPEAASDTIYALMQKCWGHYPENRPTFSEIETYLLQILSELEANSVCTCATDEYFIVQSSSV